MPGGKEVKSFVFTGASLFGSGVGGDKTTAPSPDSEREPHNVICVRWPRSPCLIGPGWLSF